MSPKIVPIPTWNEIQDDLARLDLDVSRHQAKQIRRYLEVLGLWNQIVSLTAVKSPDEMLVRHVAESLFATKIADFSQGRLADLGSGAGFPGLVLKIACPALAVALVESNGKKCAFLKEMARELDLADVAVLNQRIELVSFEPGAFSFVTSRALGRFDYVLKWAESALKPGGLLVLWLGRRDAEELEGNKIWHWQPAFKVPGSQSRLIMAGRPVNK